MKVFNVGTSQQIEIIPRYNGVINYDLEIFNEDDRKTVLLDKNDLTVNMSNFPVLRFSFNYTCKENQTFSLKLLDVNNSRILWRGKAFSTSQDTQKYKINV